MNWLTKINFLLKELTQQKSYDNPELALKILKTLAVGYDFTPKEERQINNAIKDCKTRQDIINKAIELCGEPNTPVKRYVYAKGYGWSNKEYRKLAIKYITLYLNNPLYEAIYINKYRNYYDKIGKMISDYDMRVDFHPDQFCVLNSVKSDVVSASIDILKYHYSLLEALGIKNKILVLHVGSNSFGKDNSIRRFINNFNKLPKYLKECIAIENDDKVFNVNDVLEISKNTGVPVILDYHHHLCNKSDFSFEDIFNSFNNGRVKMHFSSSKNKKNFRSHNDYINGDDFIDFIKILKKYDRDVDIMIEAKCKDDSLFRLVRYIKYKTDYKFIDDTTFMV